MCGVLMLGTSDLQVEQDAQIQAQLRHKLGRLTFIEATSVPLKYSRPMRRELMQTEIHTTRPTVQYNRMTDIHPPTNYSYKTDPLRRVCAVGRESEGVQMGGYIQGKTLHESEIMMTDNTTDQPTDANVHVVTRGRPQSTTSAPKLKAQGSCNKRLTPSRC